MNVAGLTNQIKNGALKYYEYSRYSNLGHSNTSDISLQYNQQKKTSLSAIGRLHVLLLRLQWLL